MMDDITDDELEAGLEKVRADNNPLHSNFEEDQLLELLREAGAMWRERVWSSIPTDKTFDRLYSVEGFIYDGALYLRDSDGDWEPPDRPEDSPNLGLEWLLLNPPFEELEPISTLYQYASGMEAGASPWLLFQYVIGVAVTSQGMGLNSLMGIGTEDALHLGNALRCWGGHSHKTASMYLDLLIEFGAEE